ncbi:MAG: RNA-binding cell elongation regulator Jag/EloR [Clostridia bacterium]
MRSMEFSGRSVDEAIFLGLKEMGVTIDEVEIETLKTETKGLFGFGAKQAIVRLTERAVPLVLEMEQVFQKEEANQRHANERNVRGGRTPYERSNGRAGGYSEQRDHRCEETDTVETFAYSAELAAEIPCAAFLHELLEKMGVKATVLAANTENGLRLCIDADTMGLLIGRRGETLDALQYIVSLVANKGRKDEGYVRITLDTEGYRVRREETLRRLARKNAARVRQTGRAVTMEPMNPYERRVLHSALQGFQGVTTHSEGEEPNRHVVIAPAK